MKAMDASPERSRASPAILSRLQPDAALRGGEYRDTDGENGEEEEGGEQCDAEASEIVKCERRHGRRDYR
ncbi:hypothetical protein MnTg02_02276 [bacterium MnTg02]|nr:hypothetical protein MnTg02_02276 [bacterium MnTg02]